MSNPHFHHRNLLGLHGIFSPSSSNGALLLAAVISLLLVLLFVALLHLYAKCFLLPPHRAMPAPPLSSSASSAAADAVLLDEQSPLSPSNKGLDPAAIASIPLFAYSEDGNNRGGGGVGGGLECMICLGPFQDGHVGRALPSCTHHAFHVECIDTWLLSHSTCPACRAPVVLRPSAGAACGKVPAAELASVSAEFDSASGGINDNSPAAEVAIVEVADSTTDGQLGPPALASVSTTSFGCSMKRILMSRNRSERKVHPSSSSSSSLSLSSS